MSACPTQLPVSWFLVREFDITILEPIQYWYWFLSNTPDQISAKENASYCLFASSQGRSVLVGLPFQVSSQSNIHGSPSRHEIYNDRARPGHPQLERWRTIWYIYTCLITGHVLANWRTKLYNLDPISIAEKWTMPWNCFLSWKFEPRAICPCIISMATINFLLLCQTTPISSIILTDEQKYKSWAERIWEWSASSVFLNNQSGGLPTPQMSPITVLPLVTTSGRTTTVRIWWALVICITR